MLSEERYQKIIERVGRNGSATVNELANECGVSIETIRRDLVFLEAHGRLKRVFGGAVAHRAAPRFEEYPVRELANREQKTAVGNVIASLVYEGDVIALDSGTTAMETAAALKARFRKLTVLTYSLKVFESLKDTFDVILTGGEYYPKEGALYGELAVESIARLHTDKCFIFPSAVSVRYGVEDFVPCFVPVQRQLMQYSDHVFIAADSSKFGGRALIRVCDLDPRYVYVTDGGVSKEIAKEFAEKNCNLITGE